MKLDLSSILIAAFIACGSFGWGYYAASVRNEKNVPQTDESGLSDWQILQLAIAKTESEYEPTRVGKTGDAGILQITPIYVAEANRIAGYDKFEHSDAFSPEKSFEMFETVNGNRNPNQDVHRAIHLHNPGGDAIGYEARVLRNMDSIKRYETLRNLVK